MGQLEFAVWNNFQLHDMQVSGVADDVYDLHIKETQRAEKLRYASYDIIEH